MVLRISKPFNEVLNNAGQQLLDCDPIYLGTHPTCGKPYSGHHFGKVVQKKHSCSFNDFQHQSSNYSTASPSICFDVVTILHLLQFATPNKSTPSLAPTCQTQQSTQWIECWKSKYNSESDKVLCNKVNSSMQLQQESHYVDSVDLLGVANCSRCNIVTTSKQIEGEAVE